MTLNSAGGLKLSILLGAAILLIFGLALPIMRFDSLYFFTTEPSLVGIVMSLWAEDDYLLATVVALFSILFPVVKLAALAFDVLKGGAVPQPLRGVLPYLSKWSMMDVMLVAIVVFAAKTSGFATAIAQPGLWFYAASALMSGAVLPLADMMLRHRQRSGKA